MAKDKRHGQKSEEIVMVKNNISENRQGNRQYEIQNRKTDFSSMKQNVRQC